MRQVGSKEPSSVRYICRLATICAGMYLATPARVEPLGWHSNRDGVYVQIH